VMTLEQHPVTFVAAWQFNLANLRAKVGCQDSCLLAMEGDTNSGIKVRHNDKLKKFTHKPPTVTDAIIAWLEH